ncbi:unnamed protein product [Cuscuta epithymum]|uniref:RRM domain-containing protein n=1 Tax=Cuscuta epithymum TaxID=186058 RepID=A0AAV0EW36_9ASTE|nr:unnamed protein product [Cuscuta epithymum]
MGKAKVAAAPVSAAPTKPMKKGKREAPVSAQKPSAKKQKKGSAVEQAVEKKMVEAKTKKKVENSLEEGTPDSEKKPAAIKDDSVVKKKVTSTVPAPVKKDECSSDEEGSSDNDEDVVVKNTVPSAPAPTKKVESKPVKDEDEESSDEDGDEDEESPDEDVAPKLVSANQAKNGAESEEESESASEESGSDEEDASAEKEAPASAPASTEVDETSTEEDEESSDEDVAPEAAAPSVSKKGTNGDDEDDSSDESEDEEPKKKKTKSQTPVTPKAEAEGSKTLFIGNLAWSIEQSDVLNFFKDVGEVKEVRFAVDRDGKFKGFGHVDFDTSEAALKALKLSGQELAGREVRLDLAKARGEFTPNSGKQDDSRQKQGKAEGTTVYVRGFDKDEPEEKIRSALEKHFGSCGEIKGTRIPTDQEGSIKGMAYVEFTDNNAMKKALELNDSQMGDDTLFVEEAKPRGDSGGRGGGRGGGRSGGRGRGRF